MTLLLCGLEGSHMKLKALYLYLPWVARTITSHDLLVKWSCGITWQTKCFKSPLPQCQWPPKLGRRVTYLKELLRIKLHDPLIMWSCGITWQTKNISPLLECLTPTHKITWPLIIWSCEITWQTKVIIFLQSQYAWPPNLVGWGHKMKSSYSWSHMTLLLCGLSRSRDKLKTSTTTMPTSSKVVMVVTYNDELKILKLHDSSIGWSCTLTRQIKFGIYLLLH